MVDSTDETVLHSNSVTFTCTAGGGPRNTLGWIEGNDTSVLDGLSAPLYVTDVLDSLDIVANSSQLSLTDITGADDGAVYTCVVINEAGYDLSSVTIYVLPELILDSVDLFVEYGDSVTLTCEAETHSSIIYQWERMNRNTEVFEELGGETNSTIVFPSIEYEDYGYYRCAVTTPTIDLTIYSNVSLITGKPDLLGRDHIRKTVLYMHTFIGCSIL